MKNLCIGFSWFARSGGGPGHLAAAASARGAIAYGLDFSAEMVGIARSAHPEVVVTEGDAEHLPYPDSTFHAAINGLAMAQNSTRAAIVHADVASLPPYGNSTLAPGIRSRIVNNINGLAMNILEAGFETKGRQCILLLHGFPELAYSWRKVMPPLAAAGYHVVAPDQRGYGRTTGWDDAYDGDLDSFRLPNLVRDALDSKISDP